MFPKPETRISSSGIKSCPDFDTYSPSLRLHIFCGTFKLILEQVCELFRGIALATVCFPTDTDEVRQLLASRGRVILL
jgi:hypothetical protein